MHQENNMQNVYGTLHPVINFPPRTPSQIRLVHPLKPHKLVLR
jgi:hypothetical protein